MKRLFIVSFLIRLGGVIILFFYFTLSTGESFEFDTADAKSYHNLAIVLSGIIKSGHYYIWPYLESMPFSDKGYPIYLSFIYAITYDSIFFARIINAILGSFTVIFIYKISKRNFGERTARIAAILMMLLPNLIYYTGLHLKESVMVFILVAFIERTDNLIYTRKVVVLDILLVCSLGVILFLFRTVLGVTAFASLFGAFIFAERKRSFGKRILILLWILMISFILLSNKIIAEAEKYWGEKGTNLETQMQNFASREGANKLAKYGSAAIFGPIILFAPFPTMVNIEGQENQMMLSGTYFTRNIYAFFIVIALIYIYKQKKLRNHLLIIIFILLYLGVLANSGFALSERFHLPAVPFLVILSALGITKVNKRNKRLFVPYLILISIIIISWNWFKLAGRM